METVNRIGKKRKANRTKLDARQFMQIALTITANDFTHGKGILLDAAKDLFNCNYEEFLSGASQVLAMGFAPEVNYLVEQAITSLTGKGGK
jgi:hypothetical protein